ncbi:MAG TPA: cytochrome P450 [Sporichthya sp.]|nr:cytochrome P450 [Sporichthya sp.]
MSTPTVSATSGPRLTDPFTATGPGERAAAYAELSQYGPVQLFGMPDGSPAWLVTGYPEVRAAQTDPRLLKQRTPMSNRIAQLRPDVAPALISHLLSVDGADHTRLRRLVGGAFTKHRVDALEPRIWAIAHGLLDGCESAARAGASIDLVASYAVPLPMTVICELLGVPYEWRSEFRRVSETMLAGTYAPEDEFVVAVDDLLSLLRALIALKRDEPADDLATALVAAQEGGDRLSEDELTSMIWVLILAGHETTVELIGNGVFELLTHPEQRDRLVADPALLPSAVEELLRVEPSLHMAIPMKAAEDLVIAGAPVRAGDTVLTSLMAANRDAATFPAPAADPAGLDLGRTPNHHLTFGHGVHHCLGAPLARLEGRIAFGALLGRFPRLRAAVPLDALRWHSSFLFHGLTRLPVVLEPA